MQFTLGLAIGHRRWPRRIPRIWSSIAQPVTLRAQNSPRISWWKTCQGIGRNRLTAPTSATHGATLGLLLTI